MHFTRIPECRHVYCDDRKATFTATRLMMRMVELTMPPTAWMLTLQVTMSSLTSSLTVHPATRKRKRKRKSTILGHWRRPKTPASRGKVGFVCAESLFSALSVLIHDVTGVYMVHWRMLDSLTDKLSCACDVHVCIYVHVHVHATWCDDWGATCSCSLAVYGSINIQDCQDTDNGAKCTYVQKEASMPAASGNLPPLACSES